MSNPLDPTTDAAQPRVYRVRIEGHLGPRWADGFGEMSISAERNGETLLTGPIIDQAALHGVIRRIRDLGLPLLSIMCIDSARDHGPDVRAREEDGP